MKKAFTLVEVLMVVAVIALLTAIAIPNILKTKIMANDVLAQASLKNIATAMETYYHANSGIYPTDIASLTDLTPPYLTKDYFSSPQAGFTYSNTLGVATYTITAAPTNLGITGSTTYTITTGGVLSNNQ